MVKLNQVIKSLTSILVLLAGSNSPAWSQATATGSVTVSGGGYTQSITGSLTIPTGSFNGPLEITPGLPGIAPALVNSLLINPNGINFNSPPNTLNSAAAALLSNLDPTSNLSELVSVIRAGKEFFNVTNPNQASATGSTTWSNPGGSTQSVTGEVVLPNGLYYQGAANILGQPSCTTGTGCLLITPFIEVIPQDTTAISQRITKLVIDPGTPDILNPPIDFNAAAASRLYATSIGDLSNIVSIIRAGTGANGPATSTVQGRASGSVTITLPNGSTQSVSGEISLPTGLYFDFNTDTNCTSGGACLAIKPNIIWNDNSGDLINGAQANSAYIQQLTIDPGQVFPGDPGAPTGLRPLDFNAAAAYSLYLYIDSQTPTSRELSNIVSVIRAGSGSAGLSSPTAPQARATGTTTIKLPNGSTQSVTGEVTLPPGRFYTGSSDPSCTAGNACLVVTPSFTNLPANASDDPNSLFVGSLKVDPGSINDPSVRSWNFDAAAADALNKAIDLQEQTSIIRAGASGLE